jgi:UDP:flavonoid glycosyltransferase YjiC (YdhE family)
MFSDLPGKPLVVGNAPQLELLKRAQIVISHAGPNTVLETLMQGKPLLALPMTLDQPAVAARLAALGVAVVLPAKIRSAEQIRTALLKVHNDPSYWNAAQKLQSEMQSLRGLERAADIIEEALSKLRDSAPSTQHLMTFL